VGTGADAKLAMNMMLATMMQALSEGFAFAARAGLDMRIFVDAFRLNAGWSGLAELKVPKLLERDFAPHFSLKHMNKDLRLFLSRTRELGLGLPQAERLEDRFAAAMARGWGDEDFSVLYRGVTASDTHA
jgi:3-hydroxyisobutyrate dehydrogenase-like beta-hydroxyacid dehydrogenase